MLNSNISPIWSHNMANLRPTSGWDRSLGHPCKFQLVLRLGFVIAATSFTGGQQNFAWCLAVSWAGTLYIGWSDVTYLWSQCDRHFVGQHVVLFVVKWWRFVALFESVSVGKCPHYRYLIEKVTSTDVRITNISQRTCPTKWRKTADMKKLRHCHPMYVAM